jgi:two-component system sensor histidine kinase UhpB
VVACPAEVHVSAKLKVMFDPFDQVRDGVIHAVREAIITVDEVQRVVMINPAAQRMFGHQASMALGRDVTVLVPESQRGRLAALLQEFAASGDSTFPQDGYIPLVGLHANGDELPCEAHVCRQEVADEFGARCYVTLLLRDLRPEKALQAQIQALKDGMRTIFDMAPTAIWITEGDSIVYANRACAIQFGASDPAAMVGRSIYTLLETGSHEPVREYVAKVLAGGQHATSLRERVRRLDGQVRDVVIAVAALPDHGRTVAQMVILDVSEREQAHQELERSRDELLRLSAELVTAREEERLRIARDLHDDLGQHLSALKMALLRPLPDVGGQDVHQRLASLASMVDDMVGSVRRIATELRPLVLDDLGLMAAIESLVHDASRHLGISITLDVNEEAAEAASDAAAITIYRMVQESLTNIARHAHATQAHVELEARDGQLRVSVRDNGVGLSPQSRLREGSHGLKGICERAHLLGGEMATAAAPGGGAVITIWLPLGGADRRLES